MPGATSIRGPTSNRTPAGNETKPVTTYDATEYADVDFPFKLAKAEIRAATSAAIKSKIFDRRGMMRRKTRT